MKFYLGTHMPNWLPIVNVPWFVSVTRLLDRKSTLRGQDWIMDSGGFTQIAQYGKYVIHENKYIECIEKHQPRLAFCQDWMCEPMMFEKTKLTVQAHQEKTIESYLSMKSKTDLVRPVLQGWMPQDFASHVTMYQQANVDMNQLFGIGTVCSRNGDTSSIYSILAAIKRKEPNIRLHGFGLKTSAFWDWHIADYLESADSMAWSARGRRDKLCKWCTQKSCTHCMEYALLWRRKVLQGINRTHKQLKLEALCQV